jgi:thioredoxin 1
MNIIRLLAICLVMATAVEMKAQSATEEDLDAKYATELIKPGTTAPDFTMVTPDGKPFQYAEWAKGKTVVIDFWATWCGPCRMVSPIIEELAQKYEGQVIIGKADVEEAVEVTAKFGVRNIPTVVFLKNGQVVDKVVGAAGKDVFESKVQALIG